MKKQFLLFALILLTIVSCKKDTPVTEKIYTTVKNNIYVAESPASWEPGVFIIYKMDNDSTIVIEERMYSVTGELKSKTKGYFKYTHPTLELRVQSISGCEDCFNYFTAAVAEDRKSFNYTIYDMGASKNKIIEFKLND